MASTVIIQDLITSARAYPELVPVLGTGGWEREPALSIINDVMQKFLSQGLDWKFNRANITPFLTVTLQQDYVTNVTNLSWLEQMWRCDVNNSANPNAPKPIFNMETVRDLSQTAYQGVPFNCSWIPNNLAVMGQWQANTAYPASYGVAQTPASPIQQFIDANGNILFIDSGSLGLSINSPGVSSNTTPTSTNPPFGISGATQPILPVNTIPGVTILDGTVTWTVADPLGVAMRLAPLPAFSGIAWLLFPVYQKKPPIITSLQQTLAPIPDEYAYLFRQGFIAFCKEHAGTKDSRDAYMKWEEMVMNALRSGDRERESYGFYPSESLMAGGGTASRGGLPIGPAWPFAWGPY